MQKILIVEDDSDIQELLENHLIGAGYSVVSASDGVEALSHFTTRNRPCAIRYHVTQN